MIQSALVQWPLIQLFRRGVEVQPKSTRQLEFNRTDRRRALSTIGLTALSAFAGFGVQSDPAWAQDAARNFPVKPVRVIVPFPPGGGADTLIRQLAPILTEIWAQPLIIENKPGAAGQIGGDLVSKSPPDGYTLMMGSTAVLNERNLAQFTPIALVSASPYVVTVHPSIPARTIAELLTYARSHPGDLRFGSSGAGSASHLSGELFKALSHLDLQHIPYKGTGQALTDLLAGHINLMFAPAQTVMPNVQGSKLRALAVTSARRSVALPELPTVAESGLAGYESIGWFGVLGPARMPPALAQQINAAFNKALQHPKVRKDMLDRGSDPAPAGSEEDFARFLQSDLAKWEKLIREKGINVSG